MKTSTHLSYSNISVSKEDSIPGILRQDKGDSSCYDRSNLNLEQMSQKIQKGQVEELFVR